MCGVLLYGMLSDVATCWWLCIACYRIGARQLCSWESWNRLLFDRRVFRDGSRLLVLLTHSIVSKTLELH